MSMNLHLDGLELVQTSTWITALIMSYDDEGEPDGGWQGVARRYEMWLSHEMQVHFSQAAADPSRQEWIKDFYSARIREIEAVVAKALEEGRSLDFYVM